MENKTKKETKKEVKVEKVQQALSRIQQELKAPKNLYNSYGGYNYRSCEDILSAVKPLLNGFVVLLKDELVVIGDRYYVKATAELSGNGEKIEVSAYAREALAKKGMDESQITGSASSYARKYALNGLLAIDDVKDADGMKPEKETGKEEKSKTLAIVDIFKMIDKQEDKTILEEWADKFQKSELYNAQQKRNILNRIESKLK